MGGRGRVSGGPQQSVGDLRTDGAPQNRRPRRHRGGTGGRGGTREGGRGRRLRKGRYGLRAIVSKENRTVRALRTSSDWLDWVRSECGSACGPSEARRAKIKKKWARPNDHGAAAEPDAANQNWRNFASDRHPRQPRPVRGPPALVAVASLSHLHLPRCRLPLRAATSVHENLWGRLVQRSGGRGRR